MSKNEAVASRIIIRKSDSLFLVMIVDWYL
jgi:hypothetical protein